MADDGKAVGGGWLTHTLHVWPSDELIAQSAYWPVWWYPAYERAARQLADRVACCILGGLPDCPEPIPMELQPSGSLTFSVQLWGTTIEVFVWAFEGPEDPEPDAPGPNGGLRRSTADGLVLGLRGTGKGFSVATFYDGLVPPVPVGRGARLRPWSILVTTAVWNGDRSASRTWHVTRISSPMPAVSWAAAKPGMAALMTRRASHCERRVSASPQTSAKGEGSPNRSMPSLKKLPSIAVRPTATAEMFHFYWMETTRMELRQPSSHNTRLSKPTSSERPFVFTECGANSDHHFCPGQPSSAGATGPRLN